MNSVPNTVPRFRAQLLWEPGVANVMDFNNAGQVAALHLGTGGDLPCGTLYDKAGKSAFAFLRSRVWACRTA